MITQVQSLSLLGKTTKTDMESTARWLSRREPMNEPGTSARNAPRDKTGIRRMNERR